MAVETFNALLGKLRGTANGGTAEPDRPAFKVSSNVAHVMLSLGAAIARNSVGPSAYYEETLDGEAIAPPLSLSQLQERIRKATSIAELRRLRRSFACASHPDRQKAGDAFATSEMATANRLIDEAISLMRRPR